MFGLHPSTPTRPEDYAPSRARRPLRNSRVRPRGLTPRRLAQLAGADPRGVQHVTPHPWVSEPALVLSDVVAGPQPWTGTLLDPARPQPVPIGSLVRSAGPAPARHWLVWPDARLRPGARTRGDGPAVRGRLPRRARHRPLRPRARRGGREDGPGRPRRRSPRRSRHRMRRRGGLRRRRRGGRRRDGVDRRDDPPGRPDRRPPRRHPARAWPRPPEPARRAPAGVPMALTATRVAVITRRGRSPTTPARAPDAESPPADIAPAAELPA